MDLVQTQLVSITDFRRNAGAYIRAAKTFSIVKDSKIVGQFIPAAKPQMSTKEKLEKIERLAGTFNLGTGLTAKQMNEDYDKMYDEMFPRQ